MDDVAGSGAHSREQRFRGLFAQTHDPLRRYVARRTRPDRVDDVVADALLVLWRRLDDVPLGAELPWAYGVARRCLANDRRSHERQIELATRLAQRPAFDRQDATGDDAVRVAMESLATDDREVLWLWAWEGLAPGEIAVVLGISSNAASIRLHRAKRRLKSRLEDGKDRTAAGHAAGGARRTSR